MKINRFKNTFFLNTLLIIISGFIVKSLGLLNKIVITRLLGTEGMSIYILAFPTIILFINLAGFSLNITTSKLIAESLKTKKISPKSIIKSSIKIALKLSIIIELIYILLLRIIVFRLLKNPDLYYPLLTIVFLIPLVGVTDTLRGTFSGYKKMSTVATVNILEQVFRILFSIIGLLIFSKYNVILSVSITIFALTIGEAASLVYLLIKIKNLKIDNYSVNLADKEIYKIAVPNTFSKLMGSFTYFLEPIVNTSILLFLGFSLDKINYDYTVINAYIIPLLTICSFLSTSLAVVSIPSISENHALNNKQNINYLINKIFMFSIVPGILISILLYFFPKEYMNLFFATTKGSEIIKKFVFLFLIHYLQAPGISILQAIGKSKLVFYITTFFNFLKLLLIILLSNINFINTYAIFYSIIITMTLETFVIWIFIYIKTSFVLNKQKFINLCLISIITFSIGYIFTILSTYHFLFISFSLSLIYLILIWYNKIIEINSLTHSSKDLTTQI
ncbi:MAG: oligosaccharide flippase family protein [Bacilli bacterium]|nr:oligosaccharide flippase family protein [Bacilli bacterium]